MLWGLGRVRQLVFRVGVMLSLMGLNVSLSDVPRIDLACVCFADNLQTQAR